jgi:hypothetical protein
MPPLAVGVCELAVFDCIRSACKACTDEPTTTYTGNRRTIRLVTWWLIVSRPANASYFLVGVCAYTSNSECPTDMLNLANQQ